MKVYYINGHMGDQSNKPQKLEKMLDMKITHIKFIYGVTSFESIEEQCKDADILIGSSTGAYIARVIAEKYNISLISLNPVLAIKETFEKIGVPPPNIPKPKWDHLSELVLINEDDELIDSLETEKIFYSQCKVYKQGGHRFENLEETKDDILSFIKFLYIS